MLPQEWCSARGPRKDARRQWRKDMRARGLDPDAMSPDGVDLNAMPEEPAEGAEAGEGGEGEAQTEAQGAEGAPEDEPRG